MTVRVYRSTDTSAPVLSGTAGALITVLDAVLVNGYGAQVAAGWTKPFSGTNLAGYRQGTGSNNFFLKVRDDASTAGGAQIATLRGFEVMTTVTATDSSADGTGPFPTVAQAATGNSLRKSSGADTSSRTWIIIADQRTFYMFVLTGDATAAYYSTMFGEIYSFKTSDPYRCAIGARTDTGGLQSNELFGLMPTAGIATTLAGHFLARDASGAVGAIPSGALGNTACNGGGTGTLPGFSNSANSLGMKNVTDHKVYMFPIRVNHTQGGNTVRGRYRGLWQAGHQQTTLSDGDTFIGSGSLAGKTFMAVKNIGTSALAGALCLEISDTWDTN